MNTIKITLSDARKLGLFWSDICEVTGGNSYAVQDGLIADEDVIDVPISLIKTAIELMP